MKQFFIGIITENYNGKIRDLVLEQTVGESLESIQKKLHAVMNTKISGMSKLAYSNPRIAAANVLTEETVATWQPVIDKAEQIDITELIFEGEDVYENKHAN